MNLFNSGQFTLHLGSTSNFKIDCDALTDEDWQTSARVIYEGVGRFRKVIGIPRDRLKPAEALEPYRFPNPENPILIVDDVLTTGNSFKAMKESLRQGCIGIVVFARGKCLPWITPHFN